MKIHRDVGSLPEGGPGHAVAIGVFDGVHIGHREIIRLAVESARRLDVPSLIVTFDPNPLVVLHPELKPAMLTDSAFRADLIASLGVDVLLEIPFTREFSQIGWEEFCHILAAPPIAARTIAVGRNFRFGSGGAGTAGMLRDWGRTRGIDVELPSLVTTSDHKPVSSTRVRRLIAQGDVVEAAELLGRPHVLDGVVVAGDGRGAGLGIPTANVGVSEHMAVPAVGVYAGRCRVGDRWFPAAINVGHAPTFRSGGEIRLEAFILDYDGDEIYGERVRLEFLERLRAERRFVNADALVAQVTEDVGRTREVVAERAEVL